MSKPENPFAFPLAVPGDCMVQPTDGMTLRDWFAGQALVGICAHQDSWGCTVNEIAPQAYQLADAMLAERAKGGEA
jgi:hypothetical protein